MKKKKVMAALLAGVMAVGLTACGGNRQQHHGGERHGERRGI